jgi:hypothetical protein
LDLERDGGVKRSFGTHQLSVRRTFYLGRQLI